MAQQGNRDEESGLGPALVSSGGSMSDCPRGLCAVMGEVVGEAFLLMVDSIGFRQFVKEGGMESIDEQNQRVVSFLNVTGSL